MHCLVNISHAAQAMHKPCAGHAAQLKSGSCHMRVNPRHQPLHGTCGGKTQRGTHQPGEQLLTGRVVDEDIEGRGRGATQLPAGAVSVGHQLPTRGGGSLRQHGERGHAGMLVTSRAWLLSRNQCEHLALRMAGSPKHSASMYKDCKLRSLGRARLGSGCPIAVGCAVGRSWSSGAQPNGLDAAAAGHLQQHKTNPG